MKNPYLKERSYQNENLYTKQRNFSVFLLKKAKKNHYAYLNHKDIDDNNQFWRTVELLLSNKPKSNEITLVEDNKLISEDKDYAELLIPGFSDTNSQAENIFARNESDFYFCEISIIDIYKDFSAQDCLLAMLEK